jgi:hypothetical protein
MGVPNGGSRDVDADVVTVGRGGVMKAAWPPLLGLSGLNSVDTANFDSVVSFPFVSETTFAGGSSTTRNTDASWLSKRSISFGFAILCFGAAVSGGEPDAAELEVGKGADADADVPPVEGPSPVPLEVVATVPVVLNMGS